MELKLENGQYIFDAAGFPETVSGTEALLQRARMRLAARRGSFLPDPDYGSRLYLLGRLKPSERTAAAKSYAVEALTPETAISVGTVTYTETGTDTAAVTVELLLPTASAAVSITI